MYLSCSYVISWLNKLHWRCCSSTECNKNSLFDKTLVFVWPLNVQCSYAVILHNDYICIKMQHKKVQQIAWKSIRFTIKLRWKVKNLVISRLFAAHIYSEQRWKNNNNNNQLNCVQINKKACNEAQILVQNENKITLIFHDDSSRFCFPPGPKYV